MGPVGRHLATTLSQVGHHIRAVDKDTEMLAMASEHADLQALAGNGAALAVPRRAGAHPMDLVIAVSDSDSVNMLATVTARHLGAGETIVRENRTFIPGGTDEILSGDAVIVFALSEALAVVLVVVPHRPENAHSTHISDPRDDVSVHRWGDLTGIGTSWFPSRNGPFPRSRRQSAGSLVRRTEVRLRASP